MELVTDKFLALASQKVAILVDNGNFLACKQHGTVPIPPRTVVDEDGVSIENPPYVSYEQQDSALATWLLSSVNLSLHNQLVGNSGSSCELWQTLMHIFGYHSTIKAMHYRSLLHNVPKIEFSMFAYLAKTKHRSDSLVGCEFDHVVSIITTSIVPFNLQGVTTALLDAEARQQRTTVTRDVLFVTRISNFSSWSRSRMTWW
ncbi:hypothetical protein GOBAR_AA34423 [Gossypium barbadense]|uniref:Retrotransposon Copia-like N-terminal domain-containing protein n=1 Tax=Gossypium barbadense TaxID=3634 RepID=A0A2P5W5C3_GOSBA|nr:hypothetical protein GOBAR_AA34423 [Gossypium barbadense]